MNIFFTDKTPEQIARHSFNSHCVKMILECAEMLSAVRPDGHGVNYPKSVPNHPCTKWVGQSLAHYSFVYTLMIEYMKEYKRRYGKEHKYWTADHVHNLAFVQSKWFPNTKWVCDPPKAMPEQFKHGSCLESYRRYLKFGKKKSMQVWMLPAREPYWWRDVSL